MQKQCKQVSASLWVVWKGKREGRREERKEKDWMKKERKKQKMKRKRASETNVEFIHQMSAFENVTPAIWKSKTPKTGWSGGYIFSCLIGSVELLLQKLSISICPLHAMLQLAQFWWFGQLECRCGIFGYIHHHIRPVAITCVRSPKANKEKGILPLLRFLLSPIKFAAKLLYFLCVRKPKIHSAYVYCLVLCGSGGLTILGLSVPI